MAGLVVMTIAAPAREPLAIRGLPFTRSYSLEETGASTRGARLSFDRFGRLAVVREGVYAVLNDTVWMNLAGGDGPDRMPMTCVVPAPDGRLYYGALDSWGVAEFGADGMLRQRSLVPPDPPEWIRVAAFGDVIATEDGVYFVSPNGVAFRNSHTNRTTLLNWRRITRTFLIGRRLYVSAFEQTLHFVDIETGTMREAAGTELDTNAVDQATVLDERHALLALVDGRLVVYDGRTTTPWPGRGLLPGKVSVLQHLVDGHVAIGVNGKGLFLFTTEGEPVLSLDAPEYHRITALANREPGVLWLANEDSIQKVLYSSALTTFGQRLGLTAGWPIVARWNGDIYVASYGELYRARPGPASVPSRFELLAQQPPGGAWALAGAGSHLLVGTSTAVFEMQEEGRMRELAKVADIAHLVMPDPAHCYVIGRAEIALLEFQDGRWVENVARTTGVTYPSLVHRVKHSVWVEMGGKVGRLWRNGDRLQLDTFPNDAWTKRPWVNIGSIDGIAVLTGSPGERRFFDEDLGTWGDEPALRRLLQRSPFWIERVAKDEAGTIWATHDEGLVRFTPHGSDYDMDAGSFDRISDRYPLVQILGGDDVWVVAAQSLYHVERRWTGRRAASTAPVLVSMLDARANVELLRDGGAAPPPRLPFTNNNLTFRFFSGSDAWRRTPDYEYRVSDGESWAPLAGSQLSFRGLHEGHYRLQVRLVDRHAGVGPAATFAFDILPPWHRTAAAYGLFAAAGLLVLLGIIRWSIFLERKRNRMLEAVVRERTHQLKATMDQLGEETRNAATLAERDRLANEIHDSVQQGLTGAILQLDTTLKFAAIPGEVRSRLDVVRNMVSYARQEVQHAVWDMESPLLEGTDLGEALRNLTTFANTGDTTVAVVVEGAALPLEQPTNHNLLRIAQEATTNAFRHAQARRITVTLSYAAAAVTLVIADDGVGFESERVMHERLGHMGLRGIRTRARRLDGRLTITSRPGQGTTIRVDVPVLAPAI